MFQTFTFKFLVHVTAISTWIISVIFCLFSLLSSLATLYLYGFAMLDNDISIIIHNFFLVRFKMKTVRVKTDIKYTVPPEVACVLFGNPAVSGTCLLAENSWMNG